MKREIGLWKRVDCDMIQVAMVVVDTYTVLVYEKPFKSEVIEDSIAVVTCHNLKSAKIPQNPVLSHGLVA
jgi:hypothetical protein